jgi:hypothetical protein
MNYNAFRDALRRRTRRDLMHPQERCPDSETLANYAAGELGEETKRHVGVHIAFCKDCFQEVSALEALERKSYWQELVQKLRTFCIDLSRTYGPQTLIGSVRILDESPAFAHRGDGERLFKIVEILVGENRYNVEVGITPEGSMDCEIQSADTGSEMPLMVTVHSETGEILYATEAKGGGKTTFVLSETEVPRELCVLMFTLGDRGNNLVLGMPEEVIPEG